ncbi:inositol monophosphatase [Oscillochloris sp. ZM17-4]|uniref:inositol monophosphatase family protein n=1 Tax=Oscillochloris sp. ZM17-4 TaxID=2866714 RepID=UPI001C737A18|nr:inositol monophosphatase [Oscillochloris sp. ZM17-4]
MSDVDIAEVQEWAREGGALARRYFNNVARQRKADRSWVTQADVEVETMLRERIAARHPEHGVMGEEQGVGAIDREYVWSIDPIDGTGAFVAGLPLWCVSIGLMRRGKPCLGVIYLPILDDCYWADAEGPAYRNDEQISVLTAQTIDGNDWMSVSSYAHRSFTISFPGKTRALSSIAADLCYVARGSALGALIGRANLWDLAAGMSILRAAGGVIRGLSGADLETTELLDGRKLPEPIIAAAPSMIDTLRGYVSRKP